jgi:DNA-binding MarR family transcriptional regulator
MPANPPKIVGAATIRRLARFRYQIRKFLRFSEQAARAAGLTPQQHQLLLGVAGFTGRGWATVSELAEFLQERHNAVVGLVDRARRRGLVKKETDAADRRLVRVALTPAGRKLLDRLSALHRRELARLQASDELAFRPPVERSRRPNRRRKWPAKRPGPETK